MWESLYPEVQPYCSSENTHWKEGSWEKSHPEIKAHWALKGKATVSAVYPERNLCQFKVFNVCPNF